MCEVTIKKVRLLHRLVAAVKNYGGSSSAIFLLDRHVAKNIVFPVVLFYKV